MASRMKLARGAAAVVGASVTLMMAAGIPAGADPATGKVDTSAYVNGYHVNVGGKHQDMSASLIGFELSDGTKLQMYCVEINTRIDKTHAMVEKPWDSYPNAGSPFHTNRAKINWVLHNGYPVVGADALSTLLTGQGVTLNDGINAKEAISATQAAIWHYSDNTNLDEANPLPTGPQDAKADVVALYKYLTGEANVGIGDQPTPALAVAPTELTGEAGKRIGPFTVTTTGDIQELTTDLPEGVRITDVDGVELTADLIKNGAQLYLDVPADAGEGAGSFELTASASVDTGRLFVGEKYDKKKTQSLIVATAESSEIVASAGATWTAATPPTSTETTPPTSTDTSTPTTTSSAAPAPQPKNTGGLADTGASVFTPILIGVVLVGAGIGALFFQRHRGRA
ncbi:MAG: thioester domain-containing protein [Pseudonocardiaceae bacterium]|nr:thioester domain-containing protein [Pseudonocardiaceae bacterium]